jgi:DnaJ-class molecular chaperone
MEFKDYYSVLGVPKSASAQEIKSAYRKLARKHHPDLNPGDKNAEKRFKEINEANDVLSDPEKRKKYDELGANWEQIERDREYARRYAQPGAGAAQEPFDFDLGDFFETFFGGGRGASGFRTGPGFRAAAEAAQDVEQEIELTLEHLVQGGRQRLRITLPEACPRCGGEGYIVTTAERGRQRTVRSTQTCPRCGGAGQIATTRDLEVTIPHGLTDGARIRLAGQGARGGDLYLRVRVRPHPLFRLEGYDLHAELPLLDHEAALGVQLPVPTLSGPVNLTVPPGTQTGQRLRLKGRGLPRAGGAAGDLYYEVRIRLPDQIGPRERELYAEIARLRTTRGDAQKARRHFG